MNQKQYDYQFHPNFFDTLDDATEHMTEEEFSMFFELFQHELSILHKNPYNNSRKCKCGILREKGFHTMTFHSKLPRSGTGDMRIIFEIVGESKLIFCFAIGKRINTRPRPKDDIYSKTEPMLKDRE